MIKTTLKQYLEGLRRCREAMREEGRCQIEHKNLYILTATAHKGLPTDTGWPS